MTYLHFINPPLIKPNDPVDDGHLALLKILLHQCAHAGELIARCPKDGAHLGALIAVLSNLPGVFARDLRVVEDEWAVRISDQTECGDPLTEELFVNRVMTDTYTVSLFRGEAFIGLVTLPSSGEQNDLLRAFLAAALQPG